MTAPHASRRAIPSPFIALALLVALALPRPVWASPPRATTGRTVQRRALPARTPRVTLPARRAFASSRARLLPGADAALGALATRNVPVAIVTNNSTAFARSVVQRFGLTSVRYVIGARTPAGRLARPSKPDPAMLLRAARTLRVEPGTMLFVGDSVSDIEAGRAAGMRTVGILGGVASDDEMRAAAPDFVLARFEALPDLVDQLRREGHGPSAVGTDMDGTFLDSYPDYRAALHTALQAIGYPTTLAELDAHFQGRVFSHAQANALVRSDDVARLQIAYRRAVDQILNAR